MSKPKKILELGNSIGYSTTILSKTATLWGGDITTIEIDGRIADIAKENFERYNVTNEY